MIDPNEGCSSDAVKVYCDFEKKATCVNPIKTKVQEKVVLTCKHFIAFSTLNVGGYSFTAQS